MQPEVRAAGYQTALRDYLAVAGFAAHVEVAPVRPRLIDASISLFRIGELHGAVHRINVPHRMAAAPPVGGISGLDFYLVTKGGLQLATDEGEIGLGAGEMALLRSEAALEAASAGVEMIALSMPAAMAASHPFGRDVAVNRPMPGGTGLSACLAAMLSTAAGRGDDLAAAEGAVLQAALLDAVLFLASAKPRLDEPEMSAQQAETLARLKSIALGALSEPELDPQSVARTAGVSVRTLHRLFNLSGITFGGWLRAERLERCRRELADPGQRRRTVASVAFSWGFNDISTFNRAFRDHYDLTPQALRRSLV
ncbi:AraC family transcriptional regulator [Phenylobacterium montanum]|uniref:Helix-turn-helix domain-containing protein n=1 Tax=Phenylobacterium montanum TaxID=2823693 RepID=A0A975G4R9_9CAUL|nr:AraC family transcriptional regulator [Caulobacter sp. S6]QUD90549.1 helix-turn-helix domain-containing protein [Caulobacter sp. S6]